MSTRVGAPPFDSALVHRRAVLGGSVAAVLLAAGPLRAVRKLVDGGAAPLMRPSGGRIGVVQSAADAVWSFAGLTPLLGSRFRIVGGGRWIDVLLIEARQTPAPRTGPTPTEGEAYSLLFEGAAADVMPDGHYRFLHRALPTSTLYVSPVGRGGRVQDYQVVVDRRIFASEPPTQKAG